jgi:hypothetical protein
MYHDLSNVALRDGRSTESSCVEVGIIAGSAGDIVELSACTLSDLIASREVSCVEVAAAYLDQIGRIKPTYNAIVSSRERDDVLADAPEKDELLARDIRQATRWTSIRPLEAVSLGGDMNGRACA